jgi:nucleoside-diphosphate-sugar epimerase
MRVFVTGGTGAIGRPAVTALIEAGHTVSALARTPDRAAWLEDRGARAVAVSLFDREGLALAVAGHDAVINLASAMPSTARFVLPSAWAATQRVRTEGSAAVVDAALDAGVGKVVQESVAMIYPDGGAAWIGEDVPPDRYPLAEGNLAAEASAERFTGAGGEGVVLRFGWFHGPGAAHSEELLALARRHLATMIGPPGSFVSSIHVADGGAAVVAALGAPAGVWNVVDDEPLTKRGFADALGAAVGTTPWARPPGRAALLLGHRTTSLTRSLRVSNRRFRAATGWAPRYPSAREGLAATAEVLFA